MTQVASLKQQVYKIPAPITSCHIQSPLFPVPPSLNDVGINLQIAITFLLLHPLRPCPGRYRPANVY